MALQQAHCATCGEPVQYNATALAVKRVGGKTVRYEKPISHPGWAHSDSMKRDHSAHPHDNRSPEVDLERTNESRLMADLEVNHRLQQQFDHRHAEETVNRLFSDRRNP